jgi:hypothetical protein
VVAVDNFDRQLPDPLRVRPHAHTDRSRMGLDE